MTDKTSLDKPNDMIGERRTFPGISARAWEHPTDKAATVALRKLPGLDTIIRRFVGFIGERSLRYLSLATAVRVNDRQFARIDRIYSECLQILDVPDRPDLFIAQRRAVNAGAVGMDKPFIVLNSGALELFEDDELRYVIGHELGHIRSDHALYKTMLGFLLSVSIGRFGIPLAPLAFFGIIAALKEWDRKSELSADRAGLLCVQSPDTCYRALMKMAGGGKASEMSIDEFVRQADDYDSGGDVLDSVVKLVNLMRERHPFAVTRVAELKRWVDDGSYDALMKGDYPHRADDQGASIYDEFADGAKSYQEDVNVSKDPLARFASDVAEAGAAFFDRARDMFGGRNTSDGEETDRTE